MELGRTEIIWDNLNPDFTTNLLLDYHFEEQKYLQFKVYDANEKQGIVERSDFIGESSCVLADIIANPGKQIVLTLKLPGKTQVRGNLIAKVEEMTESKEMVSIDARAAKLYDVSGMFGSLKPILYISRSMETGGFQRVYASQPASGKNCNWPRFEIPIPVLCNCDYARPLLMEVYHFQSNGSHKYVGAC